MPSKVHFIFDDSDREELTMEDVPAPAWGGEVAIDGDRFKVKSSIITYWLEAGTDTMTLVHLEPITNAE
jgi:hypothetical protein